MLYTIKYCKDVDWLIVVDDVVVMMLVLLVDVVS